MSVVDVGYKVQNKTSVGFMNWGPVENGAEWFGEKRDGMAS